MRTGRNTLNGTPNNFITEDVFRSGFRSAQFKKCSTLPRPDGILPNPASQNHQRPLKKTEGFNQTKTTWEIHSLSFNTCFGGFNNSISISIGKNSTMRNLNEKKSTMPLTLSKPLCQPRFSAAQFITPMHWEYADTEGRKTKRFRLSPIMLTINIKRTTISNSVDAEELGGGGKSRHQ